MEYAIRIIEDEENVKLGQKKIHFSKTQTRILNDKILLL